MYLRLRSQSYALYFPRIKVQRRHARKTDWAYRPFLPTYLFVMDDGRGISDIKRTEGVQAVIRDGDGPIRIKDSLLQVIRDREVDGFVQLDKLLPKAFRPGQMLRANAGPLTGQNVVFSEMSGETRAVVFFDLLKRQGLAEIDARDLEEINVKAA